VDRRPDLEPGQFTVGAFTQYISDVDDTSLLDSAGAAWVVDSQVTGNVYGQYEFTKGWAANTRLKLGVRNITDEAPPLRRTATWLAVPALRPLLYASIRKTF
jgi:iron complex outermembrane receptor protein